MFIPVSLFGLEFLSTWSKKVVFNYVQSNISSV